jgi:hypothetical protein
VLAIYFSPIIVLIILYIGQKVNPKVKKYLLN